MEFGIDSKIVYLVPDIMFKTGLVESPTCIQVQREVLVGVAIGSTAQRTKEMVEKARGATLFVDEAYRLALSTQNDFGPEAVETIMSAIEGGPETISNRPAFIFAGYPALMERFISINPGLKRRVTHRFNFPDYSGEEIAIIFKKMCEKAGLSVRDLNTDLIAEQLQNYTDISSENAGLACRMVAACKSSLNARLTSTVMAGRSVSSEDTVTITMADVLAALRSLLYWWKMDLGDE